MKEIKKQPFVCPYCKEETGFQEEVPVRGVQCLQYNKVGEPDGGGEVEVKTYYRSVYFCNNCNKKVTKAVQKYLGIYDEEKQKTEIRRLKRKLNKIRKI